MIGIEFLILLVMLILNIAICMIKEQWLVIPSIVISLFTVIISIYYVINISGLTFNIESLFCAMVAVIGALTLFIKGMEKY